MDGSQWRVLTKRDPVEERKANYHSILAIENPMNCIKGKKDITPKDESPRLEGIQYATWEDNY